MHTRRATLKHPGARTLLAPALMSAVSIGVIAAPASAMPLQSGVTAKPSAVSLQAGDPFKLPRGSVNLGPSVMNTGWFTTTVYYKQQQSWEFSQKIMEADARGDLAAADSKLLKDSMGCVGVATGSLVKALQGKGLPWVSAVCEIAVLYSQKINADLEATGKRINSAGGGCLALKFSSGLFSSEADPFVLLDAHFVPNSNRYCVPWRGGASGSW